MLTAEEMFPEKARHRELVGLLAEIRDRLPSRARPVRLEIHGWPHPPASPETASGASESDAGPSEAAPEAPPAPERPSAGDPDEALAKVLLNHIGRAQGMTWANTMLRDEYLKAARAAREHLDAESLPVTQDALERELALHERAEQAEAEVERLTRERDSQAERLREAYAEVDRLTRERDGHRAELAVTKRWVAKPTDADGNALVTVREDDVERIITTNAPRSGPDIQAFARLRRALDERGES